MGLDGANNVTEIWIQTGYRYVVFRLNCLLHILLYCPSREQRGKRCTRLAADETLELFILEEGVTDSAHHLVKALLEKNHHKRCLDRNKKKRRRGFQIAQTASLGTSV